MILSYRIININITITRLILANFTFNCILDYSFNMPDIKWRYLIKILANFYFVSILKQPCYIVIYRSRSIIYIITTSNFISTSI